MFRDRIKNTKLYEGEGGGTGSLQLSAAGLSSASSEYEKCANEILTLLTGSEEGTVEGATGGIAKKIKDMQNLWTDDEGKLFNEKASAALAAIADAANKIKTNSGYLKEVANRVNQITENVNQQVSNLLGGSGN